MPLFTPTNQKRLTNVAVVRLRKGGKRYEIACYPNKVNAWRDHLEKDLDEVLQVRSVFTNVSKGEGAKKDELLKSFGSDDIDKICIEILEKGELQVSAKEREEQLDSQFKDVATIVAGKCINPVSKKPYTVNAIEQAMKDCHIALRSTRSSKQQALDAIRKLKDTGLKIQRCRMRLSISVSRRALVDKIRPLAYKFESESFDEDSRVTTCIVLCDPGNYRAIDELITGKPGAEKPASTTNATVVAKLEIIDLQVTVDDEEDEGEDEPEEHPQGGGKHGGHAKHHEREGEEHEDTKPKKKQPASKQHQESNSGGESARGGRRHQELSDEEKQPAKGGKKGQKAPTVPVIGKQGSDDESTSTHRRGARGKFADMPDDD